MLVKCFPKDKEFLGNRQTLFFISETMTLKIEYINPKFSLQSPSHNYLFYFPGRNLRGVKTTWKSIRHEADNSYVEYVICLANVYIFYSR